MPAEILSYIKAFHIIAGVQKGVLVVQSWQMRAGAQRLDLG